MNVKLIGTPAPLSCCGRGHGKGGLWEGASLLRPVMGHSAPSQCQD